MSTKIFEALIQLDNDFGSGNDLQHNTRTNTVYRGPKYHAYKSELIEALDDLNDKFNVQVDKGDELAVSLTFYQTNVKQTTRATKDLDNMEKPTLDAMQEVLGFDDAQIVKKISQKQSHFTRALRIELWKD
ncbi:RusA family crossover junction endodeoxyribonuclease [Pediococcus pentosaceus]|uniref:RusA family crossover junction endodeoxyribonuclease n=1 Tax=Pediococcus pentosaceus TaxID=1255 RepID=UPI0039826FAA